jgi:hypothetical protein
MEDSTLRRTTPPEDASLNGSQPVRFDWPPPVQVAAFAAGATAFGLLVTHHWESGLGVLALGLVLQAWGLAQLKSTYDAMQRTFKR